MLFSQVKKTPYARVACSLIRFYHPVLVDPKHARSVLLRGAEATGPFDPIKASLRNTRKQLSMQPAEDNICFEKPFAPNGTWYHLSLDPS
mmetsp:Transcript_120437/g.179902  ORF Transcript_120437/g.179902 Transcript_120437/m.179902 type:complete len:90 (+) Transcript_120437:464-733(+)